MTRYVAFLRAINVGGHVVKMDVLRAHFEALGLTRVETFIASGNVIFESRSADVAKLTAAIEARLHSELGYDVATFLRTDAEVAAVAAYRPFTAEQLEASPTLVVGFLAEPLTAAGVAALRRLESEDDALRAEGREIYWLSRLKQSESKLSNAVFEKTLQIPATFRGMNTVRRLAAKYPCRVSRP